MARKLRAMRAPTLPSSNYALVLNEEDPSTWRLPLAREDGIPDPVLVRYALGRLSAFAHPTIPVKHAGAVRERIAAAWAKLHGETAPLPAALRAGPTRKTAALPTAPLKVTKDDAFQGDPASMGVMVALGIDPEAADMLALPQTDRLEVLPASQLHITLAYMGDLTMWPEAALEQLRQTVLRAVVLCGQEHLMGKITGYGVLIDAEDPTKGVAVASPEVEDLADFRDELEDYLEGAGLPPIGDHEWLPHITLAYGSLDALATVDAPTLTSLSFTDVLVVAGGDVARIPLAPCGSMDQGDLAMAEAVLRSNPTGRNQYSGGLPSGVAAPGGQAAKMISRADAAAIMFGHGSPQHRKALQAEKTKGRKMIQHVGKDDFSDLDPRLLEDDLETVGIAKADEAKRYTLLPLYAPDSLDSHGEWADADTIQEAVWGYVDAGHFTIDVQHVDGTTAGRCVEIVCWPWEVTVPMTSIGADGVETKDTTFPPGTAFMGVIWEPWAFGKIATGEITGISMSGTAARVRGVEPGGAS